MTLVQSRWAVVPAADRHEVDSLATQLHLPPTLVALLIQRGYANPEAAKRFLRPSLEAISDPFRLTDMDRAVEVVAGAVRAGRTILVHGDYDVDGQCAAALLTRVLRLAGARVVPFVPHRLRDGYDFGPAGLAKALECGASLVITCDCGVTAHETVARAKAAGLEIVITDHHVPRELPPADAVVNPRREDCASSCQDLCGAGVAFKLAQALCHELGLGDTAPLHFLDLVALATVADIVPLTDENRALTRHGLRLMQLTRWPGLRALLEVTGLLGKPVRAGQVGFVLAPRLNAAGRIGDAMTGLRLLLTDDESEARQLADQLETLNARRQAIDERILTEALEIVEREVDLNTNYGLVLAQSGWHPGVIGIVASRIVERHSRPTVLVALEGETGRGSGRSIPGFDLHHALARCAGHLERWGGHRFAAGLTVRSERVTDFAAAFNDVARSELTEEDLIPTQRVDLVGQLGSFDDELERLLRHLEPCGPGNPTPVLGVIEAEARNPQTVGANHVRFTLADGTGTLAAIAFDWADRLPDGWWHAPVDVAFKLDRNEWGGRSTLQARVAQIKHAD